MKSSRRAANKRPRGLQQHPQFFNPDPPFVDFPQDPNPRRRMKGAPTFGHTEALRLSAVLPAVKPATA